MNHYLKKKKLDSKYYFVLILAKSFSNVRISISNRWNGGGATGYDVTPPNIYDDQIEIDASACEWGFGPKYIHLQEQRLSNSNIVQTNVRIESKSSAVNRSTVVLFLQAAQRSAAAHTEMKISSAENPGDSEGTSFMPGLARNLPEIWQDARRDCSAVKRIIDTAPTSNVTRSSRLIIIIIIMYSYRALINALSAHITYILT